MTGLARQAPWKAEPRRTMLLWGSASCLLAMTGCQRMSAQDFVGQWQSSRSNTPIHINANGEWEVKTDEGRVLQYGLWRYNDHQLIWTFKQGERLLTDANVVVSIKPDEFRLKELNGEITVFRRLP